MKKWITAILICTGFNASAHPVAYQGATGVMTWNQSFLSDYWITYSFRPDAAIAARAMRMEMDGKEYVVAFPQLDYLVKRWNAPDYQANVYAYGGFGGAKLAEKYGRAGQVGMEADAESRKYFIMGKWESMWSNLTDPFEHGEFRLGVAPYEAEYTELASWLMVQFQYHPSLSPKFLITPLYRAFYKGFLWESGVSVRGDWMFNFMFHF